MKISWFIVIGPGRTRCCGLQHAAGVGHVCLCLHAVTLTNSCLQFSSFEIHITPTGTTIRDLLRLFCNTLEEQISHRRYFYKSSVMVHEGMVNVQK